MGSLDAALTRKALAKHVVGSVVDDKAVAIRLRYVGTGTVTSVTTVTGTGITIITSDGGTDAYTFAVYTTVGALVDAINGDGIFEAKVLDSIRSEATDDQFVDGAISSSVFRDGGVSTTVWDVLVDTSAAKYSAYRLTFDRGFEREAQKRQHRVSLQEIVYSLNVSAAEADAVRVYEIDGTTETQIFGRASVDTTETSIDFASGEGRIDAAFGNDLVVYIHDTTSITDADGNFLNAIGILE
jgi:hypothetical protein